MGCRSSKHGFSKVRVSETTRSTTNGVTSSSRKLFSKKIKSVTSWSSGQWNSSAVLKTPDTCKKTVDSSASKELQFTDFCTTKATYNKFGSKTSTITVRLSSDGSTLQIEQCEIPFEIAIQRSESAPCLGRSKGKLENNINKTFTVAAQMTPFSFGGLQDISHDASCNTVETFAYNQKPVDEIDELKSSEEVKMEQKETIQMNGLPPHVATNSKFRKSSQCTCVENSDIHVAVNECTCLLEDEINLNVNSQLPITESEERVGTLNLHKEHVNQDLSNNNMMDGCAKLKYSVGKILHCYKTQMNENIMDINSAYERIPAAERTPFENSETLEPNVSHADVLSNDVHDDQWSDCDIRHLYECSNPTLSMSLSPVTPRRSPSVCGVYGNGLYNDNGVYDVSGLYDDEFSDTGQEYSPNLVPRQVPHRNETKDVTVPGHDVHNGRRDIINDSDNECLTPYIDILKKR